VNPWSRGANTVVNTVGGPTAPRSTDFYCA
jgi:hypothetical protein